MDPDPNLPPSDPPPAPRPTPATPEGRLSRPVCEFCDCKLTHTGEILGMSDKARGYRAAAEKIAELTTIIGKLETEVRDLRAKLAPRASERSDLSL